MRSATLSLVLIVVAVAISLALTWGLATRLPPLQATAVGSVFGLLAHAALAAKIHEFVTGHKDPEKRRGAWSRATLTTAAAFSIVAADVVFLYIHEAGVPALLVDQGNRLRDQGYKTFYFHASAKHEVGNTTRGVAFRPQNGDEPAEGLRLNAAGQTIGKLAGPVAGLRTRIWGEYPEDPSGELILVESADVLPDVTHKGPELIILRRHRFAAISTLEICDLNGHRLQPPMVTIGRFSGVVFEPARNMLIVTATLPLLSTVVPELVDYLGVLRTSTLPVQKSPEVVLGIAPKDAQGVLAPALPSDGTATATPSFMYARLPDTARENAGNGWTVRVNGISLAPEKDSSFAEVKFSVTPHNSSTDQAYEQSFRIDGVGSISSGGMVQVGRRPDAPKITLQRVDLDFVSRAFPAIVDQAMATPAAETVVQSLRTRPGFSRTEMPGLDALVHYLWTCPAWVNNIGYALGTQKEDVVPATLRVWARELSLLVVTQPMRPQDRVAALHTVGTLLFRAGEASGAIQPLMMCLNDPDNRDPMGTCVVLYFAAKQATPAEAPQWRLRIARWSAEGHKPEDAYMRYLWDQALRDPTPSEADHLIPPLKPVGAVPKS